MENNENLVPVEGAENVEPTTEERQQEAKTYTQDEVDAIVGRKKARIEAKIRKEYDRKYGGLTDVLKAGTGKESVEEMTNTLAEFYEKKGIRVNKEPTYTDKDLKVLAQAEADDYIRGGLEDVVEEVERLADIGVDKMTAREKAVFKILAEHRQTAERGQKLSSIGITEDEYNSPEFQEFAGMFKESTPIEKVYAQYQKTKPKKEIKPMGSMKNSESHDNGVTEFYTPEEARAFTKKDYDSNPALFAAVEKSMLKWKR